MTVIRWFRRVLRLDDRAALAAAAQAGPVIPLVILDPAQARSRRIIPPSRRTRPSPP
ncbi:deoxyribodipyrimidine photo-lyase [Paracoccus sp. S3-43]|uniref:deoxyribodipyrimidine photo-lyase n=1 Tax=Paracoccus sp. S3-43 TaxID=3030011 RepID=UPI0023B18653|nr:deoxyribodipyrimidine photo-lyase [Paracoccus sp. S3-43]WEF24109.1 deoxyribodipyrimidine photo-lyase [Paracoccus sp. S3-43]